VALIDGHVCCCLVDPCIVDFVICQYHMLIVSLNDICSDGQVYIVKLELGPRGFTGVHWKLNERQTVPTTLTQFLSLAGLGSKR
jgi:hypothetical protein